MSEHKPHVKSPIAANISIRLSNVIVAMVGGAAKELVLDAIPETERVRIVEHLLYRGLKISLDNPYSTTEGTALKKHEAADKRLADLQSGAFGTEGSRGGGARLTPQQDAWVEWLGKKGHKASGKTLRDCQISFRAATLINQGKATKETAISKATDGIAEWITAMEEKNTSLADLIAAKVKLANGAAIEEEFVG